MENKEKEEKVKSRKILYIVIAVIIIVALAIGGYFIIRKTGSVRDKVLTAESYNEITEQVTKEFGESDEAYYFAYACMYHIMQDGLTQEYLQNQDDSILYKNVYNKTVDELIKEGKALMEENETTMEEFKKQVDTINKLSEEE